MNRNVWFKIYYIDIQYNEIRLARLISPVQAKIVEYQLILVFNTKMAASVSHCNAFLRPPEVRSIKIAVKVFKGIGRFFSLHNVRASQRF